MSLDLDFNGTWRDDMLHQQRIAFLAAQTQEQQRAAADRILELKQWNERKVDHVESGLVDTRGSR